LNKSLIVQENGEAAKYQNHDKADPLHGINLAMSVIHPEDLANCSYHRYDSCSVDITKFKGDKKEDDRE
jgi:hypothetical protein